MRYKEGKELIKNLTKEVLEELDESGWLCNVSIGKTLDFAEELNYILARNVSGYELTDNKEYLNNAVKESINAAYELKIIVKSMSEDQISSFKNCIKPVIKQGIKKVCKNMKHNYTSNAHHCNLYDYNNLASEAEIEKE